MSGPCLCGDPECGRCFPRPYRHRVVNKRANEYADTLGKLYADTPKAVFAAIAVSALTVGGDYLEAAERRVLKEWWTLHHAGIVPQKPPRPEPADDEAGL